MKPKSAVGPGSHVAADTVPARQIQARFDEGLALHHQGLLAQAQEVYRQVLMLQPRHAQALHLLGVIAAQSKNYEQAVELISRSIEITPGNAAAHANLGNAFRDCGQYQAAVDSYDKAIALKPDYASAHASRSIALNNLRHQVDAENLDKGVEHKPMAAAETFYNKGNALFELKQYQAAVDSYDSAIAIWPNAIAAYINRGLALNELKRYQEAIDSYDKAIAVWPDATEAYFNRGLALYALRKYQAAISSYDSAIALRPGTADTYYNRGIALNELEQYQLAVYNYDKAIAIKPDYIEAHFNRGIAFLKMGKYQAAVDSYDKAIAVKPDYVEAYFNRGMALTKLKQHQAALDSYDKTIAIKPDYADAYLSRANELLELKQYQDAIDSYGKAIAFTPESAFSHGLRLHAKMHICDWRDAEGELKELIQKIQDIKNVSPSLPGLTLTFSPSLPLQRKAAEIWANVNLQSKISLGSIPMRAKRKKIRIGYFSMDFRNHAVSILTAELFETHDRERFEVYAFSFGPDTKDEMRARLEAAFDRFIDVKDKSNKGIVELTRQMEIDIAIDLAGFTADSRTGIFALRAAPLQVNYLGYPGTMGVDYMDYLIADRVLIPEESRRHYSEKIIYLPSFQVNDSKRRISDKVFTREELGLPESGFVFCCFNANYKIAPNTFDGWMRILKQVDGSVLFLYADNELAATNLRREASQRGVNAGRLVFGKKLPATEYLARYRAADLFLDTLPFNAGTTASDALWVGLPVLTCTGEAFASRMAASLLSAIDLPELITTVQEDYEALAVQLATHPELLEAIKQKLQRNRLTTLLFDTKLFTRNIEEAYTQMYERYRADLPPEHIHVKQSQQRDSDILK